MEESYFHVKILILVCPSRACKIFENRSADTVLMTKMNFDRDENGYFFENIYMIIKTFVRYVICVIL